jgi:hypothetical protein
MRGQPPSYAQSSTTVAMAKFQQLRISESDNPPQGHQSKPSEEPIPVVAHLLGGGRFQDKAHQERYARSCTESAYHPFKNNQ